MRYLFFLVFAFGFIACKSSTTRENERLQERIDARTEYMEYLQRYGIKKGDSMWRDRGKDLWLLDEADSMRRADSLNKAK